MPPITSGTRAGETLEDYLAGEYHTDMGDIGDLEDTLKRVANLFIYTCREDGRWPYEIRNGREEEGGRLRKPSHGTQAMIAACLMKMSGDGTLASGRSARLDLKSSDDLRRAQRSGIECLSASLANEGKLTSGTFGQNDPMTLSHVADLLRDARGTARNDVKQIRQLLGPALAELRELAQEDPARTSGLLRHLPRVATIRDGERLPTKKEWKVRGQKPDYVINAFVPLRIIRAINDLKIGGIPVFEAPDQARNDLTSPFYEGYRRFFESTIHDQLSFSSIPDSRFDPAELIFCLEGLMLCGPNAVDDKLFEKILSVLKEKQEVSAHWRPNRPMYATPQGMAMLPVSVEGAISLMKSISLMERYSDYQPLSRMAVPRIRRFWQWLHARMGAVPAAKVPPPPTGLTNDERERIKAVDKNRYRKLAGWHSEHVNDPNLIHLWDTSQVVEFMLAYRELLHRAIAGRSLLLSRLAINRSLREPPRDWTFDWITTLDRFEPRAGEGSEEQVYYHLYKDFIDPWALKRPHNFSMLLYGPPGTGKSTLAENIADSLGLRMITVTVSDFLGKGGANVEARAKAIFQTLESQFDSVILFDEIDSFLLDRDSKLYRAQDTLFQFLTPGMLTKINDLRKMQRCIFIIATNYENRIDPAIKRKGRVDKKYLLSLPNKLQRRKIIKSLAKFRIDIDSIPDSIDKNTLFFGFSDLKALVSDAKRKGDGLDSIDSALTTGDYRPATSVASYLQRQDEENFPVEELCDLIGLGRQVIDPYPIAEALNNSATKTIGKDLCKKLEERFP